MKRWIVNIVKLVVPLALIGWLLVKTCRSDSDAFEQLAQSEKHYGIIAGSLALLVMANVVAFCRWYVLIRALQLPTTLWDVLRLGFLGFLLNFVGPGQVGGDFFKAILIAREQKERRMEAVATVLIDRVCGLYGLLLVASTALLFSGLYKANQTMAVVGSATFACTIIATVGLFALMIPRITNSPFFRWCERLPMIGNMVERLFFALKLYQRQRWELAKVAAMSVSVHLMIATGIYFSAAGLFQDIPSLVDHWVVSPIAGVAGALPLTPAGLGTYEAAMVYLYNVVEAGKYLDRGVVVALVFRLSTIATAAVGLVFYFRKKQELQELVDTGGQESQSAEPLGISR
ncbi:MAG: lysylphosphatidylglycerol synthase transmembrane domain-containing protein [Pirellulaceae bacterium]